MPLKNSTSIDIIPAVIPASLRDLVHHAEQVVGHAPVMQIDVVDGLFVKSRNWPYVGNTEQAADFLAITKEEDGLPFWEQIEYEVDLMVADPMSAALLWRAAGAKRVIFHVESLVVGAAAGIAGAGPLVTPEALREYADYTDLVEVGIAIGTETSIDVLALYAEVVPGAFFQCMGIATIGFQGQPFDERVLGQISALKARYPDRIISVDGGVTTETAARLVAAGATRLVAGSAVFEAATPAEGIAELAAAAGEVASA